MAVVDDQHRQRHIVLRGKIHDLGRHGTVLGIGQNGHLAAGLQHGVLDGGQVAVALTAQLLQQLIHRKPVPGHILLENLPG